MQFRRELLLAVLMTGCRFLNAQNATSAPPTDSQIPANANQPADAGNIPQARLVHRVLPKYPGAIHAKVADTVVLDVLIARNGNVQDIRVVSGWVLFVKETVDAVRRWAYETYPLNDQTLAVRTQVTVNFESDGKVNVTEGARTLQKVEDGGFPASIAKIAGPYTGEVLRVGKDGVSPPRAVYSPEPRYSDKARQEKLRGPVVLTLIITPEGQSSDIKVSKGLRADVDAQAIAAVSQWRFLPSAKNGKPVAVLISVQVDFQL